MRCVILQPSFVPWRGYFDLIRRADVFVFYDDVQYDKHGWRNRNRIKTAQGSRWLTVPVRSKGASQRGLLLVDVMINHKIDWRRKHLATLRQAYGRAPHVDATLAVLERAYADDPQRLVDLTIPLTVVLARRLGLTGTRFERSSELDVAGGRTERLVRICRHFGADHYLSGPAASAYIDADAFEAAGITLEYMAYDYPEYPQLHPPFNGQVSILDLLFMAGHEAGRWIGG